MSGREAVTVVLPGILLVAGIVVAALITASRHPGIGVRCGLELWLAAALLRLADGSWSSIGAAAVLGVAHQAAGRVITGRPAR